MKPPSTRRLAFTLLKWLLTAALTVLLVSRIGWGNLAVYLQRLPRFWAPLSLLALGFTLLKTWKWSLLISAAGGPRSFVPALRSYLIGMAGGLLTPGRLGEISRSVGLTGIAPATAVTLVLIEKVVETATVVALAVPGLLRWHAVTALGAAAAAVVTVLFLLPDAWSLRWAARLEREERGVKGKLRRAALDCLRIPRPRRAAVLGLGFVCYGLAVLEFHLLLRGFAGTPVVVAVLSQPVIMLANLLPLTIGGLGVREGTAVLVLAPFAVGAGPAAAASFWLFFLNTALPAVAGGLWLFRRRS